MCTGRRTARAWLLLMRAVRTVGQGGGGARRSGIAVTSAKAAAKIIGVALPVCILLGGIVHGWPATLALAGVSCASGAYLVLDGRKNRRIMLRVRRIEYLCDRVHMLIKSLPRRTEAETLAVLHEIRNCYTEAHGLAGALHVGGRRIAPAIEGNLAAINWLYGVQTGSLRCTEANAADFAAAMRRLGRDSDGSLR